MITNTGGNRIYKEIQDRLTEAYAEIHNTGNWIDHKYTASVEQKLKNITGRKHARLVTSGTSAILVGLLAWGMISKKVACPNLSYVASANQAALINDVDFFDVDRSGLMDITQGFEHDAIIPVSLYGNTIDYDRLNISGHTKVIVDCAQSLGSKYKGKPDGSFGDAAVFSFARNKPIPTAGTHGALVWDDDAMVEPVLTAAVNGKLGRTNPITSMGINATPFELQAAWIDIGLDHMDEWQKRRHKIHEYYKESFSNLPIKIIEAEPYCESNHQKFALLSKDRDHLYEHFLSQDIETPKHYTDNFGEFFGSDKTFPITDELCKQILTLPNHAWLTDAEIETVANTMKGFYQ